ncbi:MAG: tRNA lysidine(34) synthetase TilS [Anaerovoracaceae bacterium]|jgi:tRNA(Ile)-lysidine synthase
MDTLFEKVKRFIREEDLFNAHTHIVLGLSGGPDSVCLFDVLRKLAPDMDLTIHPVHVNHQLRGESALSDQNYVLGLCRAAGIPLKLVTFDCEKLARERGVTTEEAGRDRRYQAFFEEAEHIRQTGVPRQRLVIAVAHQSDDQVETVLFRLLRGTGPDGLAGMLPKRPDDSGFTVVRPLLSCSRQEIQDYCERHELDPHFDETNGQKDYARNRIRLEVLPYLEDRNPGTRSALLRLAAACRQDRAHFDVLVRQALGEAEQERGPGRLVLSRAALGRLKKPVLRRLLREAFDQIGLKEDLSYQNLQDAEAAIRGGAPSAALDLPHSFGLECRYDSVVLFQKEAVESGAPQFRYRISVVSREEFQEFKADFTAADAAGTSKVNGTGMAATEAAEATKANGTAAAATGAAETSKVNSPELAAADAAGTSKVNGTGMAATEAAEATKANGTAAAATGAAETSKVNSPELAAMDASETSIATGTGTAATDAAETAKVNGAEITAADAAGTSKVDGTETAASDVTEPSKATGTETAAADAAENSKATDPEKTVPTPSPNDTSLIRRTYAAFDLEQLEEAYGPGIERRIELRGRRPGDRIAIPGGRKKIQDLFVDRKVPKSLREGIRYFAAGSDVLFIPPQPGWGVHAMYSKSFCLTTQTKSVLIIENHSTL